MTADGMCSCVWSIPADLGTARSTYLQLAWPTVTTGGRLMLLGPAAPSENCSSSTRMCLGAPGVSSPLLRGTIE